MQIIPLTRNYKDAWDEIVYASDEAWMFHLYDYIVNVDLGVWGYKSLSFLIEDENRKIVGIFPMFLKEYKKKNFIKECLLSSNGWGIAGLALINELNNKRRIKIREFAYNYVNLLARDYNVDRLEIRLPPLAPAYLPPLNKKINPLIFSGLKDNSTNTYIVNLSDKSKEQLWEGLKDGCQRAVKKALKNGVSVKQARGINDIKTYYMLHVDTYNRTGVKPHPFKYFETIFNSKWANIFFAIYEKKIIAALNLAAFKTGVLYWTGASLTDYLDLRANNLLQWNGILWAKKQGYKWYDSGEAWLGTNDTKLKGLTRFKSSFGGELYPFYKGIKIYKPIKNKFFDLIKELRKGIK